MVEVEVCQLGHGNRLFAEVDHGVVAHVQPRDLTKSTRREDSGREMSTHISVLERHRPFFASPAHGLGGEELQLVVVQAETAECEQSGKRLVGQIVEGVVAKTKPLYIVQALEDALYTQRTTIHMVKRYKCQHNINRTFSRSLKEYLEGQVGDVY